MLEADLDDGQPRITRKITHLVSCAAGLSIATLDATAVAYGNGYYSYVDAATLAGYATFHVDRIGIGTWPASLTPSSARA